MQLMSFVVIEKNNKFLLIKEASEKWGGEWFFPGGKVNCTESVVDAAIREVLEEAGCHVLVNGIFHFRYFRTLLADALHIYFRGYTSDDPKHIPDENSLDARWFAPEEMKHLRLRQNALDVVKAYNQHRHEIPPSHLKLVS
jgi:8-oxo-dGTP pyrophosphatase MutT (NUDIX family)